MATGTISQRLPCSARALDDEPLGLECGIELRQDVVDEGAAGYRCPGYWRGAAHGRHRRPTAPGAYMLGRHRRPRRLLDAGERATGTPIVHQRVTKAVLADALDDEPLGLECGIELAQLSQVGGKTE